LTFKEIIILNTNKQTENWLFEINPKHNLLQLNFKEIWRYRDLLWLFVKRDVVTLYKQTILGPLWYLIQPLFTMVIYTVIFNKVAGIATEGVPAYLFNLAGIVTWNYFSQSLTATSDTFKANENIFGKVYFPRIIMPLSVIFSNLLKYAIQMGIFVGFYLYFVFVNGEKVSPNSSIIFLPILILAMAMTGLGLGMIFSSMVTKYRDLKFLLAFGIQLLMYMSAVFYPLSLVNDKMPEYAWIVNYNPMAHIIETARYMLLGTGVVTSFGIIYTGVFAIFVFFTGIIIFNKTEKTFIDTV
jgi:lipopolysaccharide transport system permease protein